MEHMEHTTNIGYMLGPDVTTSNFYQTCSDEVDDLMDNPQNVLHILAKDVVLSRYLKGRFFRKCIMYHTADTPQHNIGNFELRGGYTSDKDCVNDMMKRCHTTIIRNL